MRFVVNNKSKVKIQFIKNVKAFNFHENLGITKYSLGKKSKQF